MTFHQIKYPKELSRKKKLELYKCFILEPLKKGSPVREIEVNVDKDRWALTKELAVQYALNRLGRTAALQLLFNTLDDYAALPKSPTEEELSEMEDNTSPLKNRDSFFVILTVTLKNGVMDEDIIIPPYPSYDEDLDPQYDPQQGLLTVTIKDRYDSMSIKNYTLHDIYVSVDSGTDLLRIDHLEMDEVVINSALTGGK